MKSLRRRVEEFEGAAQPLPARSRSPYSQPMDDLARFARLISHELRNPLGVLSNAAYFLNLALKDKDENIQTALRLMDQEIGNANRILKDVITYACPQPRGQSRCKSMPF